MFQGNSVHEEGTLGCLRVLKNKREKNNSNIDETSVVNKSILHSSGACFVLHNIKTRPKNAKLSMWRESVEFVVAQSTSCHHGR